MKAIVSHFQELCFLSNLRWDSKRAKNAALSLLPIIGWMRMYKVKEWLLGDLVSGVSTGLVAIMQGREEDMLMWGKDQIYETICIQTKKDNTIHIKYVNKG